MPIARLRGDKRGPGRGGRGGTDQVGGVVEKPFAAIHITWGRHRRCRG